MAKEKRLKNIFEPLDLHKFGASELFNDNIMKEYKITKHQDLFLLFLPTYSMFTTFQNMLTGEHFDTFNEIVPQIEQFFDKFISDEPLIMLFIMLLIIKKMSRILLDVQFLVKYAKTVLNYLFV
jgi:hypothetical protein